MMTSQEKLDLYKTHKADYKAPKKPLLVKIASTLYLTIEGWGIPGGEQFQNAIGALYAVAFTIKMTYKSDGQDYAVCKLEALWWVDGDKSFQDSRPEDIHYILMIRTPDFIKKSHLTKAHNALLNRGKTPQVCHVKLEKLNEGYCVQMLHVGPYDQEKVTIEQMSKFANDEGWSITGRHHEIYLSDPRRVPPERLRTILRLPVKRTKVSR